MKDVNKAMLAVLLIPAYLTVFIVLLGAAVGSIRWGYTAGLLLLFGIGAWLSSHRGAVKRNAAGCAAFAIAGGYIILSSVFKPDHQRSGFEYYEIVIGAIVVCFGLVPLLYQIVKWRSVRSKT